jgi:hypothetical protein
MLVVRPYHLGALVIFRLKKNSYSSSPISIVFTALFFVMPGNILMGMLSYPGRSILAAGFIMPCCRNRGRGDKVSGNGWQSAHSRNRLLIIVLALIMLVGGDFVVRPSF